MFRPLLSYFGVGAGVWSCRRERGFSYQTKDTIHLFPYDSHNSKLLLHQLVLRFEWWL